MNGKQFTNKIIIGGLLAFAMIFVHAAKPVWKFTPLTPTTITVAANETTTVSYRVTNQSRRLHLLAMIPIPGVTQITTSGNCPNPFVLNYQQSCILNLSINGSALNGNILGGPVVCQQGNPNQCYQPANSLNITKGPAVDYTLGGSVFGLLGTLVLLNNEGDALTINADGTFTFSNSIARGSSYAVTIKNQPANQTCTLINGSGIMGEGNVTNVNLNCVTNITPLSTSIRNLALSVDCTSAGGSCVYSNAALTGNPREIIITNTSAIDITTPLTVTALGFPAGTSITWDNCTGTTLAPLSTCSLIITPGQVATSACTSGIAPTPGAVTVNASLASGAVTSNVVVLSYGCIYQGGFVYSIDDTTATTESISGKTVAVNDTYAGQTGFPFGDPNWGGIGIDVGSSTWETSPSGANDGDANTATITSALGCTSSTSPSYAACLCTNLSLNAAGSPCTSPSNCYTNWYLPAICELATFGGFCTAGSENIQEQLYNASPAISANFVDDAFYWSSTEYSNDPQNTTLYEHFVTSGSSQGAEAKDFALGVRCSRAF